MKRPQKLDKKANERGTEKYEKEWFREELERDMFPERQDGAFRRPFPYHLILDSVPLFSLWMLALCRQTISSHSSV